MRWPSRGRITRLVAMVVLLALAHASESFAEVGGVVVAVVEPAVVEPGSSGLGYYVALGKSRYGTTKSILDGLGQVRGEHLAILIHEKLPITTIGTLVSMASKVGYMPNDIKVFVFGDDRTSIMELPGYKYFKFSTDPVKMREVFR